MIISLETIIELYKVYLFDHIVLASAAVVIVILCNLASCAYHRVLAKNEDKSFLLMNVLNGHLAVFYQLACTLYLGLLLCEMTEIRENEDYNVARQSLIQITKFYFDIKMIQITVAIATKHYKPGLCIMY